MALLVGAVHYVLLGHPQWLPRTFTPEAGLTPFKVRFEYALATAYVLAGVGFLMHLRHAREFGLSHLALASFTMAMSEIFFTLYANVTDVYNVAGHFYKILAYGFLYRGLFVETVQIPYLDLRAAEARQRATLNTLPDLLFEVDRKGAYLAVHANETSKLLTPLPQLLGKTLDEALPPAAAAQCFEALAEAERTGMSRGQRITLPLPLGERHFELSVSRKSAVAGQPDTFLMLSRDITPTVENEERIRSEAGLNAALLDLQQHDIHQPEADLLRRGLAHVQTLTGSALAVLYFVHDDARGTSLAACSHENAPPDMPPWETALRERRAVVTNAPHDAAAGRAPGGATARWACVPVVEGGRPRLLLGVAGKARDYHPRDAQALQTVADALWKHTAQRRQEAVIHRLSEALDQSPSPVVITDIDASIVYVNKAFSEVSGYGAQEVLGRNPRVLQSGLTPRTTYADMWTKLPRGLPWQGELINRRKNGQVYTENASLYPVRDVFGEVTHYVAHMEDITQRREAEERIRALSNYDTLTGLLNKKAFDEQLTQAIDRADASHERVSVLWFDLDNFKLVNETLGHAAGDELLLEMGNRLRACLAPHIPVARYSGDAFTAIVPLADQAAVALLAQDALAQLQTTLQIHGHAVSVSASAGIAVYPDDARTAQHLGVRRGSGDVPRQAGRAQRAALLRTRDAGAHAAFAGAGRRPQGRGAPRRAVPGVPAPAHAGQRRAGGRRGAAALAPSALGAGVSGRVHPDRRAKRLHRGHRFLGGGAGGAAVARLGCRGPAAAGGGGERIGCAVRAAALRRGAGAHPAAHGRFAPAHRGGADRGRRAEKPGTGRDHHPPPA